MGLNFSKKSMVERKISNGLEDALKNLTNPFSEALAKLNPSIPESVTKMMREYVAGKLGPIDEHYLDEVMFKYNTVFELCTIIEGSGQESPGDILIGFYLTLLDVQPTSNKITDKTAAIRTFYKWQCKKASKASVNTHKPAKDRALEIARHMRDKDPLATKGDLAKGINMALQKEGIKNGNEPYSELTIRDWLKPIKGKTGRPRTS